MFTLSYFYCFLHTVKTVCKIPICVTDNEQDIVSRDMYNIISKICKINNCNSLSSDLCSVMFKFFNVEIILTLCFPLSSILLTNLKNTEPSCKGKSWLQKIVKHYLHSQFFMHVIELIEFIKMIVLNQINHETKDSFCQPWLLSSTWTVRQPYSSPGHAFVSIHGGVKWSSIISFWKWTLNNGVCR